MKNHETLLLETALLFIVLLSIPAFAACDSQRGRFFPDSSFDTIHPSGVNAEAVNNSVTHQDFLFQSFRPRQYNPQLGRFMQRDPLGVVPNPQKPNKFKPTEQYQDGIGLYEYVKSNPVMNIDSYGLEKAKEDCGYIVDCTKDIEDIDPKKEKALEDFNISHCDIRKKELSTNEKVYSVWKSESGVINYGQYIGTLCKCASCGEIGECISSVRKDLPWGSFYPNCHTQTTVILKRCCLSSDYSSILAGPDPIPPSKWKKWKYLSFVAGYH